MSIVGALARRAPTPVYCVVGDGGRDPLRRLRIDPRLRFVKSPRHATVLLALGEFGAELAFSARRVHDQVPCPRGVVHWGGTSDSPFPGAARVDAAGDPARAIIGLHRALLSGERPSSESLGPKDNPVGWIGVGPHGQGGQGMMGGKPYGRRMAMTGPDERDGLELDRVPVTVGPFVHWMPPGLRVSVELQGDVIQSLTARVAKLRHVDLPDAFVRAQAEAVAVSELELARARHHLASVAELLELMGLDALAERALRLAARLAPQSIDAVRRFARNLRISGALVLGTRRIGVLPSEGLTGGPVARAAGIARDARADDPAYRSLGFETVTHSGGDAEARWQQRLAEAVQALDLAARAGARVRQPGATLEGPRGPIGRHLVDAADWLELLRESGVGSAWDAFVTTLVSLDLDPATLRATGDFDEVDRAGEGDGEDSSEGQGSGGDDDNGEDDEDPGGDAEAGAGKPFGEQEAGCRT